MTETLVTDALHWYASHNCALFPIPHGSKAPFGIVASFAHDHSSDPGTWKKWREAHNCNFGLVAGPSRLIIVDVDVAEVGRDVAWRYWSEWCKSHDLPVFSPSVQSARGGWHILFSLPADLEVASLRQCPLVGAIEGVSKKAIIDLRVGNGFVVAAGSYYDGTAKGETSGEYLLMSDAPPHPAPAALLAACARAVPKTNGVSLAGSRDRGDVAALLRWMTDKDMFSEYSDWLGAGLALKLEYGDDALDLWEICHNDSVTADVIENKWRSFATDPKPGMATLNSLLKRAHAASWGGSIRTSAAQMFDGVAQLAAMSGASLSSGMPTPPAAGLPMMAGQAELSRLATPILAEFLDATKDTPAATGDFPTLPAAMSGHGLYGPMCDAIGRVVALASPQGKWKPSRVTAPLAVLSVLHADVYAAVVRHVETAGRTIYTSKVKLAAAALADNVQRAFVKQDDWVYDARSGLPESDNPDNISTFLGILSADVRWNNWLNRAEIQGFEWPKWQAIDDMVIGRLKMRALRTGTRFRVSGEFLKETLLALAHDSQHDPVTTHIDSLVWDGTPRLGTWLSETLGVPADAYHAAVGANVVGGMVKRARRPGCKHDEVMILLGAQGLAKSTMCRTLAMFGDWFTDSVSFEGSPQNIIPQLFGKLVVELQELDGMAKKEVQHIKAFITRQSDNVTLKYKAFAADYPRRCIFIGSSNDDAPLVDLTGNRRFLPVRVDSEINIGWLQNNISALVAEAATLEAAGADFSIPRSVWQDAAEHQEAARSVSDVEARLSEWFAETPFTTQAYVTTADLAELADLAGWKGQHTLRNAVLRRLGFREAQCYVEAKKVRVWYRGQNALGKHVSAATRYTVGRDERSGRVRVRVVSGVAASLPPLPY